jgi:hypothetical protein
VDRLRCLPFDRKDAYDKAIDGAPEFIDPPALEVVRIVEEGDVVMAELTGTAKRAAGGELPMSMAEVFVMRDGKISERRAWRTSTVEVKDRVQPTPCAGARGQKAPANLSGSSPRCWQTER